MKKICLLLLIMGLVSSCTLQSHYTQTGSITYEPVAPESVTIHPGDIDQEYVVIGAIAVDALGQGRQTKELLKKKAASIGANAVINTELSKISSGLVRTGMNGIAVRLK